MSGPSESRKSTPRAGRRGGQACLAEAYLQSPRHPVAVYRASLGPSSRRTMKQALQVISSRLTFALKDHCVAGSNRRGARNAKHGHPRERMAFCADDHGIQQRVGDHEPCERCLEPPGDQRSRSRTRPYQTSKPLSTKKTAAKAARRSERFSPERHRPQPTERPPILGYLRRASAATRLPVFKSWRGFVVSRVALEPAGSILYRRNRPISPLRLRTL